MAVRESLVGITAYREAEEEVARTSTRSLAALVLLREGLSDLLGHCRTLHLSAATELVPLEEALGAWASRKLPTHQRERSLATLTTGLETLLRNRVLPDLEAVPLPGEPEAVAQIDDLVLHLSGLDQAMSRLVELLRLAREYRRVEEGFSTILDVIQKRAATMVNDVVKRLQSDVQRLYAMIHPDGTIPAIHIVPDTEARALLLRVDFHALGRTVPPAGYLSESQINTLGLALFLSAVRLFNSEFPFVFLDDIVSSYDAEHRSNIVNVIAEELGGFQVLLTTHDRMFFDMLRARLANKDWQFETIQGWALDEGPRRRTNLPQDQEIERLFKDKDRHQEAGNAVRRFMEEWLDRACAKYRAYTPHVREEKEYQRTLFDFWEPLMNRIDALQADFRTRVVNATSYKRLKVHALINFYSHHRPDPYMWGSMGDVIGVWGDFKEFTKLFNCSSCGNELRYDKDSGKVYCACGRGFLPQPDPPKEASS